MRNSLKRTFFLIPAVPTPNGRLHLGHIGGPFLKMDILTRFNRQIGNTVYLYGGTDPYESYVLIKAFDENKNPDEICFYFHEAIEKDLKKMSIDMDFFANPAGEDINFEYTKIVKKFSSELIKLGHGTKIEERYPYSDRVGYLPPSFIAGVCPHCKSGMAGFICEDCGLIFRPEQILNKTSRVALDQFGEKKIYNWFVPIDRAALEKKFKHLKLDQKILQVAKNYCDFTKDARLSVPIRWGVDAGDGLVYYSYAMLFAYYVLLGEQCQRNNNLSSQPFLADSGIETAISFGFDNISTFIVDVLNHVHVMPDYKWVDYYLINRFLTLNGLKFSTSRNHAIWVDKMSPKINVDLVRLFLLKVNVDNRENDFNVAEFLDFYNQQVAFFNKNIVEKLSAFKELVIIPNADIEAHLYEILKQRSNYLMPENYNGQKVFADIMNWMALADEFQTEMSHRYAWLKGLAVLLYPVMPNISCTLWRILGEDGMPTLQNFNVSKSLVAIDSFPHLALLTMDDVQIG